jgi:EmrB/QacA subfamily drug resistance transporter
VSRNSKNAFSPTPAARGERLLLVVASLCSILAPLNSTMIAVALPQIRDDFGLRPAAVAWLVSGYLIAMAVAQPIGGRLGDQYGRRRVLSVGLACFAAFSLLAALSPAFWALILFRVCQAITGAGLIPNAAALLRENVPAARLGRVTGVTGSAIAAAAGIGPLLGAASLAAGSWRWVFVASIPIAAVALLLTPRLPARSLPQLARPLDWLGAMLFAASLIGITFSLGLLDMSRVGAAELAFVVSTVLCLAAFGWRQRVSAAPTAEWSLFRERSFAAAGAHILLSNLVMYTTLLMVPFLVRDVLGANPAAGGLLLGVMALCMGVAAPVGGRLSDARGRRLPAQLGAVLSLISAVLTYALLDRTFTTVQLGVLLALLGTGVGLSTGPASTAAIESAPVTLAGSAAGTSSMMRYLGSIVGAGVLAGVLGAASPTAGTFRVLQLTVVMMAVGSIVAASLIHKFPRIMTSGAAA